MDRKHLDIIIKGNIQNIGFSFQVLRIADNLGVKGYVAYVNNSTAKIEVEGNVTVLKKFIEMCNNEIPEAGKLEMITTPSIYKAYKKFIINEI